MSLDLNLDSERVDFARVNSAALAVLPSLLARWLPGGKRQGGEYLARNPKRADRSPGSFSVNVRSGRWSDFATSDRGGDPVSLYAFLEGLSQVDAARDLAGQLGVDGSVADVAGVAGGTGKSQSGKGSGDADSWRPIVPVPADAPKITDTFVQRCGPSGFRLTAGYRYVTAQGELVGHIARFESRPNGHAKKSFLPFTYCEDLGGKREWRSKGFPDPRPLYGLDLLAANPAKVVLAVEGEKTVQAAAKRFPDMVITTSPGGAKAAKKADWSPLTGRHVVVWPDADEAGARYAADVVDLLRNAGAASVRMVDLPNGLPEGWDLADDLPPGVTDADLVKAIESPKEAPADGPLPLFPSLPPAERYPVEALGPVLSRAAAAIARKVQVPEAIAAQSVLAAAALAAQVHADVRLPFGQNRPLSLYLVTIAGSGDRKSTADNEALWPIAKHEKALRATRDEEMKSYKIDVAAWGAQKKKIEADGKISLDERRERLMALGDEPEQPLEAYLIVSNLTIEGLLKTWVRAPAGLGVFTAEGGQFTGGHGMSEERRLETAGIYSELWDGKAVKRIRALDGATVLYGRRLSAHLMIQPGAAATFLSDATLRDQGLLSRVLVAAPDSIAGSRLYRETAPDDDQSIKAYGARLLSILEAPWPLADGKANELEPRTLAISAAAEAVWREFFDHIEEQSGRAADLWPIRDFAAKAAEHAARIAGVLTIIENHRAAEIGVAAMQSGLALADWYVAEALRLQQGARTDPRLLRATALLEWMQERSEAEVTFRSILQLGPSPLRTKDAAEEALNILFRHGWIVEQPDRPRRFRLIPAGGSR